MLARIDEWGKAPWLVLTLVAFWFAWPLGLALLAFLFGSGRLQAWRNEASGLKGRWSNLRGDAGNGATGRFAWPGCSASTASGNAAFDAYRAAELDRLEEEQRQFKAFIEQLRQARDKAEFDQFMADRRRRTQGDTGVPAPRPDSPPAGS